MGSLLSFFKLILSTRRCLPVVESSHPIIVLSRWRLLPVLRQFVVKSLELVLPAALGPVLFLARAAHSALRSYKALDQEEEQTSER